MGHESQTRYSKLVSAKLRNELVLRDGIVFNNDYEGNPVAGNVKIPVRDTEVQVSDYDNRSPTYIRRAIGAVYWEEKLERADGADRSPHGEVFISIPALSAGSYVPKTDDRIVGEIITDEQPPNTALTITAVSDFRFGSGAVRHIEVTAKC